MDGPMTPVQLKCDSIIKPLHTERIMENAYGPDLLGLSWVLIKLTHLGTLLFFSFSKQNKTPQNWSVPPWVLLKTGTAS